MLRGGLRSVLAQPEMGAEAWDVARLSRLLASPTGDCPPTLQTLCFKYGAAPVRAAGSNVCLSLFRYELGVLATTRRHRPRGRRRGRRKTSATDNPRPGSRRRLPDAHRRSAAAAAANTRPTSEPARATATHRDVAAAPDHVVHPRRLPPGEVNDAPHASRARASTCTRGPAVAASRPVLVARSRSAGSCSVSGVQT